MDMYDDERERKIAMIGQFYEFVSTAEYEKMYELCTDDVRMSIPYQLPGFPNQGQGKDQLRQLNGAMDNYSSTAQSVVDVEPMLNPDSFLVEVKGDMVVRETGRPYRNDYLNIFRFRDGKICEWVSYHDPVRQLVAFGFTELPIPAES